MLNMPNVICAGNLVVDVNARPVDAMPGFGIINFADSIVTLPGGNGGNTACALGALGIRVSLVARIGKDSFGTFLLDHLRQRAVDISHIVVDAGLPTGTTIAIINERGERSGVHSIGANANLHENDFRWESLIHPESYFHLCAYFLMPQLDGLPAARVLKEARARGFMISLDVSWDARGRWLGLLEPCLEFVDFFLPNEEEARELTGRRTVDEMARFLLDRGVKTVVIKRGPAGCYMRSERETLALPAHPVKVVDTTGAGDTFVGGFLAGKSWGWNIEKCCRLGNAAAALHIAGPPGLHSKEQVLAFLGS